MPKPNSTATRRYLAARKTIISITYRFIREDRFILVRALTGNQIIHSKVVFLAINIQTFNLKLKSDTLSSFSFVRDKIGNEGKAFIHHCVCIRDVGKSDLNKSKTRDPCSSRSRHCFSQVLGVPSTVPMTS